MTDAEIIDEAATFVPPEHFPSSLNDCRSLLYRLARIWGTQTALGELTIDEAYHLVRSAAETVQVSTAGAARWQAEMQFCTWIVDQTVHRIGQAVAVSDGKATYALKTAGVAAISAGADDRRLRAAIADAAERFDIAPPVELLNEAYHNAIATARSNARWMATRGTSP